jgi:hypothetical protein
VNFADLVYHTVKKKFIKTYRRIGNLRNFSTQKLSSNGWFFHIIAESHSTFRAALDSSISSVNRKNNLGSA